jgi:hypothetical protein
MLDVVFELEGKHMPGVSFEEVLDIFSSEKLGFTASVSLFQCNYA